MLAKSFWGGSGGWDARSRKAESSQMNIHGAKKLKEVLTCITRIFIPTMVCLIPDTQFMVQLRFR
jgi:hypothetical protein